MNKVILTGNIVRDIELTQSQNNNAVVSNCIAVRREFKNPNGEYDSDFINFVAWNNQANYLANYAKKGDRVELVGRWQTRNYQNQQGVTVYVNEVVVESITAFSKEPKQDQEQKPKLQDQPKYTDSFNEISEEDLPF